MSLVDQYAPCLCGSGRKYKFCCSSGEAAVRLALVARENGQHQAEVQAIEEGLQRYPDVPWLIVNKAMLETEAGQVAPARDRLLALVRRMPDHALAGTMLARLVGESEGPARLSELIQDRLEATAPGEGGPLATLVMEAAEGMFAEGLLAAAVAHARLARQLGGAEIKRPRWEASGAIPPWLKPLSPWAIPEEAATEPRFVAALRAADSGRWRQADALFRELFGLGGLLGPSALYNHMYCRLFLGDQAAAASALQSVLDFVPPDHPDGDDLATLLYLIAPTPREAEVPQLRLSWKVRDRHKLIEALKADPTILQQGREPTADGKADILRFALLDRPSLTEVDPDKLSSRDIPVRRAELILEEDSLSLEGFDDGRLDALTQQVVQRAGEALPPAHPKTKTVGSAPGDTLATAWEGLLPQGIDSMAARRLQLEQRQHIYAVVWPDVPMWWLRGKTPRQAAAGTPAERRLIRGVLVALEDANAMAGEVDQSRGPRAALGIDLEADLTEAEMAAMPLTRLHRAPCERLDDEKLVGVFERARQFGAVRAVFRSAQELTRRPHLFERVLDPKPVFGELAQAAFERGEVAEALRLIRAGCEVDPRRDEPARAVSWEMSGLRMRVQAEGPETWVPDLAKLLESFGNVPEAAPVLTTNLINLGLFRLVADPRDPERTAVDPRPLQMLLRMHGPKVVAAPGAVAGAGGGGLWTPGQPTPRPVAPPAPKDSGGSGSARGGSGLILPRG